jgi:hypothetical protein
VYEPISRNPSVAGTPLEIGCPAFGSRLKSISHFIVAEEFILQRNGSKVIKGCDNVLQNRVLPKWGEGIALSIGLLEVEECT